uniref:Uncharacterized protein n=1 Tax=Glossina palpalis gambiensis TaxID=67801 RepID=A0A1B0B4M1_9MUSC
MKMQTGSAQHGPTCSAKTTPEFYLDASGNVEELRKRWGRFVGGKHTFKTTIRFLELQEKHETAQILWSSRAPTVTRALTSTPIDAEIQAREQILD